MKQTAVEWLYDKIKHGITKKQFDEFILEAKEMEKQQIFDAYREFIDFSLPDKVCDEHYKETFKHE